MKVCSNKLIFPAVYDSEEAAVIMVDRVRKIISNVHDMHREYSSDYKIYYTKRMIEQIKKHQDDYDFVFDVIASVMKICEIPERRVAVRRDGKIVTITVHNKFIGKIVGQEIDHRNVWSIMFKKKIECPQCHAKYSADVGANYYKTCPNCLHRFRVSVPRPGEKSDPSLDLDFEGHI